uniref:ARAD1A04598p n=1 Tax=Blastobotrys adeninivorans TaxID=409370 RepID=A0A060T2Y4_BLAAD
MWSQLAIGAAQSYILPIFVICFGSLRPGSVSHYPSVLQVLGQLGPPALAPSLSPEPFARVLIMAFHPMSHINVWFRASRNPATLQISPF